MNQEFPTDPILIPMEVTDGGKPTVIEITLRFVPTPTGNPQEFVLAPQIIGCKNLITGKGYEREDVPHLVKDHDLRRAIEMLHWYVATDEYAEEETRDQVFEALGEYEGPAMLPLQ